MAEEFAYFDTSVLVKLYVDEEGAAPARRLGRRYRVVSSAIARAEVTSALRRKMAAREMTDQQFRAVLSTVQDERDNWTLVEVDAGVIERAEAIILSAFVRTLDALHLASAIIFQ